MLLDRERGAFPAIAKKALGISDYINIQSYIYIRYHAKVPMVVSKLIHSFVVTWVLKVRSTDQQHKHHLVAY